MGRVSQRARLGEDAPRPLDRREHDPAAGEDGAAEREKGEDEDDIAGHGIAYTGGGAGACGARAPTSPASPL